MYRTASYLGEEHLRKPPSTFYLLLFHKLFPDLNLLRASFEASLHTLHTKVN